MPDRIARVVAASEEVAEKKAFGLPLLPNAR